MHLLISLFSTLILLALMIFSGWYSREGWMLNLIAYAGATCVIVTIFLIKLWRAKINLTVNS